MNKVNVVDWEDCFYFNAKIIGDDSFQKLKDSVGNFAIKYFQTPSYYAPSVWE